MRHNEMREIGWAAWAIIAILLIVILGGCAAPQSFTGTCAMKPLGQSEHGHIITLVHCEAAPE